MYILLFKHLLLFLKSDLVKVLTMDHSLVILLRIRPIKKNLIKSSALKLLTFI